VVAVKAERWVLAVAMLLPSAAAVTYFVALGDSAAHDRQRNPLMQAAYAASKLVQFALPVLWLSFADRAALRPRWPSVRGLPTGIVFGLGVAALIFSIYYGWLGKSMVFAGLSDRVQDKMTESGVGTPMRYIVFAASLSAVHSLLEEYYWRWFVYGRLRRHLPPWAAVAGSATAFMAHHVVILSVFFPGWFWQAVVPFSCAIAVGGIVWAWLYERSGSLVGPWVSHLIVDAALMWVGYDLAFRD
jgi:membrane protease YdiL (CAAX protease family)